MALQVRLTQGLKQSLTMTPQLQQAIKLLQLNYLEYRDAVEQELIENPLLEEIPQEEPSEEEEKKEEVKDMEAYLDRLQESKEYVVPEVQSSFESYTAKAETLQEHLLNQLRLLDIEDHIKLILAHIIGNLDQDGYLTCEHEELCQSCGCDLDDVNAALEVLKTFEPSGLGARNLGECLLFQLDSMGLGDNLAAQIVRKHLDKVERRKFDLIAKEENCSIDEIASAITILQRLEPKPGRSFGADETR
jgi:RNA polymerase sigma-54 factor